MKSQVYKSLFGTGPRTFNETKRQNSFTIYLRMAADDSQPDDLISLEDLVRETSPPANAPPPPPVGESVANIDKVLAVEDPGFTQELDAIKAAGVTPEADIKVDSDVELIVDREKTEQAAKGFKKLKLVLLVRPWRRFVIALMQVKAVVPWLKETALPATKAGAIKSFAATKTGATWLLAKTKIGLGWFSKQPRTSKFLIVAVAILAVGAVYMTRVAIRGSFLPTLERDFLYSFATGADATYKFEEGEAWQDLNDPLLHPEHIVLLERLVVNLKNPGDGRNPMALLDLYVEGGSQDAAIEIKARDAEVRDMVLRTMEQMSYDELVTETGKSKLKVFLRKNLNDMITKGRVRRLFIKSIILKP